MTALDTRPDVDLLDPTFHVADPHPAYRWMRAHEPVFRERNGLVCITRWADVRAIERRAEVFVSDRGYRSLWTPQEVSMISKNDPEHMEQRRLVAQMFAPPAVQAREEEIRAIVIDALDGFGKGPVEVVDAFTARVPSLVTCRLLGWPDARWRDVRSWSERLMRVDTLMRIPGQLDDAVATMRDMGALMDEQLAARRAEPRSDLMSIWAHASLGGCPMTRSTIHYEVGLVVPGGAETTRTTLSRALVLFAERPDLWAWLVAHPRAIPGAVEELLRWVTPLNNMFRTAVADTTIAGVPVRDGDRIVLVYPSANRDEKVFDRPDDVVLDRSPNPHVAFGWGTHFCLGAHVARAVLSIALEELTRRYPRIRAAGDPSYEANVFVKAVERFEVHFNASAA